MMINAVGLSLWDAKEFAMDRSGGECLEDIGLFLGGQAVGDDGARRLW
jgi:hypothetical protein